MLLERNADRAQAREEKAAILGDPRHSRQTELLAPKVPLRS